MLPRMAFGDSNRKNTNNDIGMHTTPHQVIIVNEPSVHSRFKCLHFTSNDWISAKCVGDATMRVQCLPRT